MTYATKSDLYDRFGQIEIEQLADKDNSADAAAIADTVARALADADAEINGYLEGVYQLPLASTPRFLNSLASDIARYYLAGSTVVEDIEKKYKFAIRSLEKINKEQIRLNIKEVTIGESPVIRRKRPPVFDFGGN